MELHWGEKMKKKTPTRLIATVALTLLLLSGCTQKLSIEEFENLCGNTGGTYAPTQNQDFNVCDCAGKAGIDTVFYKDVKSKESNEPFGFHGCVIA